jgi:hypothetical protein
MFSSVIQRHEVQIFLIKSKQINLENFSLCAKCEQIFQEEICAKAQELKKLYAEFEASFLSKLCSHRIARS